MDDCLLSEDSKSPSVHFLRPARQMDETGPSSTSRVLLGSLELKEIL